MTSLETVADGVLVATHPFCTTTTTVVIGAADSCLVIDPAVTVDEVDALATELSTRGLQVTAGFSTHPHWDHLLWRDSLGEAPRYATAAGAAKALTRVQHNVDNAAGPTPGHAAHVFTGVTALDPGARTLPWPGRAVDVVEHRAHAPGHAGLYLPEVGVLIAGDMVSDIEIPLPDHEAEDPLADYAAALEMFAALDVALLVPGHGTVGDATEFRRRLDADRRYITAVGEGHDIDDPRLAGADDWLHAEHAATLARVTQT